MLSEHLLNELHNLTRADKLRIVQLLVNELALEETAPDALLLSAAFGAAETLQSMLDDYGCDLPTIE